QKLINKAFGNDYIDDARLPQALELTLEILEDFTNYKKKTAEVPPIIHLPLYIKLMPTPKSVKLEQHRDSTNGIYDYNEEGKMAREREGTVIVEEAK
ncbi:7464_t:CDS:2, partial [Racocetra persica]